jgi:RND family efflux transporter MFP subunit
MPTTEPQTLPTAPPSRPESPSPAPDTNGRPVKVRQAAASRWTGRVLRAVVLGGVGCALVWLAGAWWLPTRKVADVLTAVATRGDLVITVTERGELESARFVQVACEIEGGAKLAKIIPEGTRVKKGDEVCRFDPDAIVKAISEQEVKWEQAEGKVKAAVSELEVQKNKAESEIAKAQLALTLAKLDFDSYEEGEYQVELDKRKGTLELGKKELKEAEDNLEFTRGLVKKGFAQLEQIRVMELNAEGKRYTVRQQEADLRVFEKYTKLRKLTEFRAKADDALRELERTKKSQAAATDKVESELKAAQKTAGLEKRQLERLQHQLQHCVVTAPEDGIVIYYRRRWDDSSRIRQGASLNYMQTIFSLPDLDQMQVNLNVHESVVKKVIKGQTATMQIEALSNQTLHGRVSTVGTVAQSDDWRGNAVKEYKTEVSIDDLPADAGLRPGMSAEVKILIKTVPDALTVPVQGIAEFDGQHICYVLTPSGLQRREIKVGESNQQLIQVTEGLAEGERVALDARVRAAADLKTSERKDRREEPKDKDKDRKKSSSPPPRK